MAAEPPTLPPSKKSRWLRRLGVFVLIVCPLLLAAAYLIENRRGDRAWDNAKARLAAEGETLDLASLWPPPVPREESFCATPALDGIAEVIDGDDKKGEPARKRERLMALDYTRQGLYEKPTLKRGEIDWTAWRDYLAKAGYLPVPEDEPDPAKAVFAAFERHSALFDELAEAATTKQQAAFTPTLAELTTNRSAFELQRPHMTPLSTLAGAVALRGRAAVAGHQREIARSAVQTLFRLRDASAQEGWLVGALLALSAQNHAAAVVFEGTADRLWTKDDYDLWHKELERVKWSVALLRAHRIELASMASFLDEAADNPRRVPDVLGGISGGQSMGERVLLWMIPRGWVRQNQATVVRRHLDHFIGPLRDGAMHEMLRHAPLLRREIVAAKTGYSPYALVIAVGFPVFESVAQRMAFAEIDRLQLLTACALERFFLRNHRYPETLSELQPGFLSEIPPDVDGQPLRYARDETNGRYRLWSVGLNLADDWRGHPPPAKASVKGESSAGSPRALDWVLSFPAIH